jgi:hypothetical protein
MKIIIFDVIRDYTRLTISIIDSTEIPRLESLKLSFMLESKDQRAGGVLVLVYDRTLSSTQLCIVRME